MLGKPSKRAQKKLEEHGTRAPATVVEIAERGMAVTSGAEGIVANTEVLLKTTLRVEPPNEPTFDVTKRIRWPQLSIPSAGSKVNVIFDPEDHDELMIDRGAPVVPAIPGFTTTSTDSTTINLGGNVMPDLNKMLGAINEARAESGGDRAKFAEELRENLAEQGITAQSVSAGDGPMVLGGFGAPQSPEDQRLARLEQLGKLKASGVLTEEEFEAEKAKILGSS
jgi:hypothetical protein